MPPFPPELEELYRPLWQQVASLFEKWKTFVTLFGTSDADLQVVNRAAGVFFGLIQEVMMGDLLLSASRLTDRMGTGQRTNLSLEALVRGIDATQHPSLRAVAEETLIAASQKAAFAHGWRNRQIAHLDRRTALGSHAEPLPEYTRAEVQQALDAIAAVVNAVSVHFGESPTAFEDVISAPGDAESLVKRLRDGLELQDWRFRSRMNGGTGILPPEV